MAGWSRSIVGRNSSDCATDSKTRGAISSPLRTRCSITSPATGRALFKDLPFEELKRLQIETLSADGIADAETGVTGPGYGDHIMGIALSDSTGWEELLIVDPKNVEESERAALKRLTAVIKERDPDVIEGHDLFRFHLP